LLFIFISKSHLELLNSLQKYLCTGYDVYVTREPTIFEAMALTHSRVRRVIYGIQDTRCGGLGGTGSKNAVHSLPGTNHKYRAFRCNPEDDESSFFAECKKLHSEKLDSCYL